MDQFHKPASLHAWPGSSTTGCREAANAQRHTGKAQDMPPDSVTRNSPARRVAKLAVLCFATVLSMMCLVESASAQEKLDLKVWTIIPGLGSFSHIPIPDPESSSSTSIVGSKARYDDLKWYYNRYPNDTGHFQLPKFLSGEVLSGDFTGDSVQDLLGRGMESGSYLFSGAPNSNPLRNTPERISNLKFNAFTRLVLDLDKDGRTDIISAGEGNLGFVLFGNHQDSAWHWQPLEASDFSQYRVSPWAYFMYNGKLRVVAVVRGEPFEYLYQFEADSVTPNNPINLKAIGWIDGLTEEKPDGKFLDYWAWGNSSFYRDNSTGEAFFVAGRNIYKNRVWNSMVNDVYRLTDSGFSYVTSKSGSWTFYRSDIGTSIDGDTINDMLVWSYKMIDGDSVLGIEFFSKAPWYPESRSLGWIRRLGWQQEWIKPVGDVNGDGLIDIGRAGEPGLLIYLSGSGVVSAQDSGSQGELPLTITPSPVRRSGTLSVSIDDNSITILSLELFDLRGTRIVQQVPVSAEARSSLDLSRLALVPGTYTLSIRTTNGILSRTIAVAED